MGDEPVAAPTLRAGSRMGCAEGGGGAEEEGRGCSMMAGLWDAGEGVRGRGRLGSLEGRLG